VTMAARAPSSRRARSAATASTVEVVPCHPWHPQRRRDPGSRRFRPACIVATSANMHPMATVTMAVQDRSSRRVPSAAIALTVGVVLCHPWHPQRRSYPGSRRSRPVYIVATSANMHLTATVMTADQDRSTQHAQLAAIALIVGGVQYHPRPLHLQPQRPRRPHRHRLCRRHWHHRRRRLRRFWPPPYRLHHHP